MRASTEKIVLNGRGGFCYELNSLFGELLKKLGFDLRLLSASVFNKQKNEFGPEFDHMALLVKLDDIYLVDVGFGDSFRKPISLSEKFSEDISGTYRIDILNEDFTLQKLESEEWISLYKFSDTGRKLSDFYNMCIFNSTSKESSFTRRKICTIALPKGRKTLSDESFTLTINKSKFRFPLDGYQNYITVLKNFFGIDVHDMKEKK